jgi:hypothetical protein
MPKPNRYVYTGKSNKQKRADEKALRYFRSKAHAQEKLILEVLKWKDQRELLVNVSDDMEIRLVDATLYANIVKYLKDQETWKAGLHDGSTSPQSVEHDLPSGHREGTHHLEEDREAQVSIPLPSHQQRQA